MMDRYNGVFFKKNDDNTNRHGHISPCGGAIHETLFRRVYCDPIAIAKSSLFSFAAPHTRERIDTVLLLM